MLLNIKAKGRLFLYFLSRALPLKGLVYSGLITPAGVTVDDISTLDAGLLSTTTLDDSVFALEVVTLSAFLPQAEKSINTEVTASNPVTNIFFFISSSISCYTEGVKYGFLFYFHHFSL